MSRLGRDAEIVLEGRFEIAPALRLLVELRERAEGRAVGAKIVEDRPVGDDRVVDVAERDVRARRALEEAALGHAVGGVLFALLQDLDEGAFVTAALVETIEREERLLVGRILVEALFPRRDRAGVVGERLFGELAEPREERAAHLGVGLELPARSAPARS